MLVENELKYILNPNKIPEILEGLNQYNIKSVDIIQAWLPGNGRIRSIDNNMFYFNYKHKCKEIDRIIEIETEIDSDTFLLLMQDSKPRLKKIRFSFESNSIINDKIEAVWDIDCYYQDNPNTPYIITAECEMANPFQEKPSSLHPIVQQYLFYSVPRNEGSDYSSKKLCDKESALNIISKITKKVLKK